MKDSLNLFISKFQIRSVEIWFNVFIFLFVSLDLFFIQKMASNKTEVENKTLKFDTNIDFNFENVKEEFNFDN